MRLSDYLEKTKITEVEIARLAGCTQPTINRLRNGKNAPSIGLARRIAIATQGAVTPNDFLDMDTLQQEEAK